MRPITAMTALIFALISASTAAFAQEPYRCKVGGQMVIQDSPCKIAGPSGATPAPRAAEAAEQPPAAQGRNDLQERLARDKAYLDERAKLRQKTEAQEQIQQCDANASALQAEIDYVSSSRGPDYKPNLAGLAAMQLDEERRQTRIAGLQSQVTAKRHECDQLRAAFDRQYRK